MQPFRQYTENPSWLAVRQLQGLTLTQAPPPLNTTTSTLEPASHSPAPLERRTIAFSTSLIPVNYTDALELVPPLHDTENPYDLIIHVGVGLPGKIVLERRARRWGYNKEGADGKLAESDGKKRGFVGEEWDVGDELRTRINRDKVVEWVRRRGVEKLGLSNDAGELMATAFADILLILLLQDSISASSPSFAPSRWPKGRLRRKTRFQRLSSSSTYRRESFKSAQKRIEGLELTVLTR